MSLGYGARVNRPNPHATSPWPFVGMCGMAAVLFLFAVTGTVVAAPWWVVALLMLVWLVAFAVGCAWFTRRPRALAVLPVALTGAWFALVVLGARSLGWG